MQILKFTSEDIKQIEAHKHKTYWPKMKSLILKL